MALSTPLVKELEHAFLEVRRQIYGFSSESDLMEAMKAESAQFEELEAEMQEALLDELCERRLTQPQQAALARLSKL